MHLVVETIWEQYKHSDNLVIKNESNLKVDIDKKYKTVLKGFIDKILIHDDHIIVLDYKTNDEYVKSQINIILAQDMPIIFIGNTYEPIQLQEKIKEDVFVKDN